MRAVDIIIKKRDNGELSGKEIAFFVDGFTHGAIPDYQVAAWAMAVVLNGMTARETTDLTLAMARSGEILDLKEVVKMAVDKHSTGGVGDKTSFVVLPIVAACGLPVGKMSGRGLGFSGGTLDKIESIPGFRVDLSTIEFKRQLQNIGIVLTGQSLDLAPADGKLYALRDVTGTVQSLPLIASSIMSKKIAGGAQAILLDVKVGLGAFMTTLTDARNLANMMIDIGKMSGRQVSAVISDMNQPLGQAVGNSLEVIESLDVLRGLGPADFREHCLHVSAHMLALGACVQDISSGRRMCEQALSSGSAFSKFRELVNAQGGDVSFVDEPDKFPQTKIVDVIKADRSGYLAQVHARLIGEAAVALGAGRARKGDPVDHAVGFIVHRKVGDYVERDQPLITIHANDEYKWIDVKESIQGAFGWSEQPVNPLPLFYEP